MKTGMIFRTTIFAVMLTVALSSCMGDLGESQEVVNKNSVTFVVSLPNGNGGANVTRSTTGDNETYRNYNEGADVETYGTAFGGYPDAETEMAAFKRAVAAMNAEKSRSDQAGTTRAVTEGSGQEVQDNRLDEITILLFDPDTDEYVDRIEVDDAIIEQYPGDRQRKKFTLELPDGNYNALFIANSNTEVDQFMTTYPQPTIEQIRTRLYLPLMSLGERLSFDDKPFPMSSNVVEFAIPGTRNYDRYPIELIRMVAKINIRSIAHNGQFLIKEIIVRNVNAHGRLIPSPDWKKAAGIFDPSALNEQGNPDLTSRIDYTDKITNNVGSRDYSQCVDEIFVYEQTAHDSDPLTGYNDVLSIFIRAEGRMNATNQSLTPFNGWYRINLLKTDPADGSTKLVNIVRNYCYDIVITGVNSPGYDSEYDAYDNLPDGLEVEIEAWNNEEGDMNETSYNGEYQLVTDRSVIILGPEDKSQASMKVYTDYSGDWTHTEASHSSSLPHGNIAINSEGVGPDGADILNITTNSENNTGSIRRTSFTIRAGALQKEIVVIQLPYSHNVTAKSSNVTDYVGAFWKHDQRGERLIGIKPYKEWSAFVLDGADWVVMDTKPSPDPGVRTIGGPSIDGNDSGFERSNAVGSTIGWAHGRTSVEGGYFRIGLRNSHAATSTNPARYAVVLVVDGDATNMSAISTIAASRLLYIRQGEWADYLFRNEDPVVGTVIPNRTVTAKFSPYNLTATTLNAQVGLKGAEPNPGVFTDYPSQAGGLFTWASTIPRYVYSPVGSAAMQTALKNNFWNVHESTHESCPEGYRRPNVGPINNYIDNNSQSYMPIAELQQSLYLEPKAGLTDALSTSISNSVPGHYADGWFDRRQPTASAVGIPASTVAANDPNRVAYAGRLFFNPNNHASIFFPFAGNRGPATLVYPGNTGTYWTSGTAGNQNQIYQGGVAFCVSDIGTNMGSNEQHFGRSIRCVKEQQRYKKTVLSGQDFGVVVASPTLDHTVFQNYWNSNVDRIPFNEIAQWDNRKPPQWVWTYSNSLLSGETGETITMEHEFDIQGETIVDTKLAFAADNAMALWINDIYIMSTPASILMNNELSVIAGAMGSINDTGWSNVVVIKNPKLLNACLRPGKNTITILARNVANPILYPGLDPYNNDPDREEYDTTNNAGGVLFAFQIESQDL